MELVKKTSEYKIFKKRSGRFCVQNEKRSWVNGEDKVKILVGEKLIKAAMPKPKEEPKEEPAEAKADEAKDSEAKTEEEK